MSQSVSASVGSEVASPSREKRFYRPELDCLRFFAFMCVFVHHTLPKQPEFYILHALPGWLAYLARAGASGVDLFFCLSAYLITELLVREKEFRGELNVKAFYARRILRIWPLYFAFLGCAVLLTKLDPHQSFSLKHLLMFLFLSGNWSFIWFGVPASVAVPLWSVSVEEQFYLLWPLVVRGASLTVIRNVAIGLVSAAFIGRFLSSKYSHNAYMFNWNGTISHLDSIGYGILLAIALRHRAPSLRMIHRVAFLLAGAAGWLVAAAHADSTVFAMPIVALGSASILTATIGMPLRNRVVVKLGIVSYGLYVYHMLVINYLATSAEGSLFRFILHWLVMLAVTVALALASYRWMEKPFLRLKERFSFVHSRPL